MSDRYRCINAFSFEERIYAGGEEVSGDDPILKSHGEHFVQARDRSGPTVLEAAVAAPGERRNLTPPAKKAAPRAAQKKGDDTHA